MGRVDIITGTFGKAMGGASGGYTASKKEVVDLLRQRSRPYLFSNTLAPAICAATIETINMLEAVSYTHLDVYKRQEVEDAVVMGGSVIQAGAVVKHCIVAENVTIGKKAVVGACLLYTSRCV